LRSTNDHWPWIGAEFFEFIRHNGCMICFADRLCMTIVRTESGYFIKCQAGATGDYQVVIGQCFIILKQEDVAFGLNPFGCRADKTDSMFAQQIR